jgi:hypothetical protein
MSGVLGLLSTDLLFAEPGTSQPEYWRLGQAILGIGSLHVLGRICQSPCFEKLHFMYGVKPPEAVQAREFWLRQEGWTEIAIINMGREDTSYHRINQGSGPQGKLLWSQEEIETEKEWWKGGNVAGSGTQRTTRHEKTQNPEKDNEEPWREVASDGKGTEVIEGTTDKWWMDRWQIEALAVASKLNLTLEDTCDLLSTAYFGRSVGGRQLLFSGIMSAVLTICTFLAAWFTHWSWIPQFFALTCLGYFVNWIASLRGWKFEPASAEEVRTFIPKIHKMWPTPEELKDCGGAIRIAVQSSGIAHMRGIIVLPRDVLNAAKKEAILKRGRYYEARSSNELKIPYSNEQEESHRWISFESQSSFYGLLVSIGPDNVHRRSIGVIWALIDGLLLLILGFGASIRHNWGGYVLSIYISGMVIAIFSRRRRATWTLPEFRNIDFTTEPPVIPPAMESRIRGMKAANFLTKCKVCNLACVLIIEF